MAESKHRSLKPPHNILANIFNEKFLYFKKNNFIKIIYNAYVHIYIIYIYILWVYLFIYVYTTIII